MRRLLESGELPADYDGPFLQLATEVICIYGDIYMYVHVCMDPSTHTLYSIPHPIQAAEFG